MKCPEYNEKLVDYLYNDLPPEEKREMDEHFAACEHCAKQLSQFQLVRTSFQQLKKQEPSSLVHQRILAHAKDMVLQQRRSWLTQLLLKPLTATVMVALLAISIFYYTQYVPLNINNDKLIVEAEKAREGKEKRDYMSKDESMVSALGSRKKAETTLSADPVTGRAIKEDKALPARAPAFTPPGAQERLFAQSRPSAKVSGGMHPEQPKVLTQMARVEDNKGAKVSSTQSKDALYAFEMGNLYFSQSEFEKAIATYSLALMMNPQGRYSDTIRYQLAMSYKKLDDCKSAVKVLDDIQKRHPQHPEIDKVIIMAGDCYMDLRVYDKAESNYTNFINRYPDRKSQVADKLEIARKFRRVNLSY